MLKKEKEIIGWWKGKKRPPITDKHRKNLSKAHKSQIPWNKGMKGYLKGRKIIWADKISIGKKNSLRSILASKKAAKNMSKRNIGRISLRKGVKLSEETKRKIKLSYKGWFDGEKSYLWKGGISFEPYSMDWTETLKRSIRERDSYACQLCGTHQDEINYELHVHHIDYNKKNCNPANLISLCRECHTKTNHNRDVWIKYFSRRDHE